MNKTKLGDDAVSAVFINRSSVSILCLRLCIRWRRLLVRLLLILLLILRIGLWHLEWLLILLLSLSLSLSLILHLRHRRWGLVLLGHLILSLRGLGLVVILGLDLLRRGWDWDLRVLMFVLLKLLSCSLLTSGDLSIQQPDTRLCLFQQFGVFRCNSFLEFLGD